MIQPLALSASLASRIELRRRNWTDKNIQRILTIAREVAENELADVVEHRHYTKALNILSREW